MTQPIGGYRQTNTDALLNRVMEESGNHDPTRIQSDTGRPLHFDATDSASVHRADRRTNGAALDGAKDAAIDKVLDKAIDKVGEMVERFAPSLGAFGPVGTAVFGLGSMYRSVEEDKREGELQSALGASDAGVVALSQSLHFDRSFASYVAQTHAGSGNAAAAMAAVLQDSAHDSMRAELQLRADRGFVDAAGYARNAAAAVRPVFDEAKAKELDASRMRAGRATPMREPS